MKLIDELKILDDKIKQMKLNMISTEKKLKFLHYHLKKWINMSI